MYVGVRVAWCNIVYFFAGCLFKMRIVLLFAIYAQILIVTSNVIPTRPSAPSTLAALPRESTNFFVKLFNMVCEILGDEYETKNGSNKQSIIEVNDESLFIEPFRFRDETNFTIDWATIDTKHDLFYNITITGPDHLVPNTHAIEELHNAIEKLDQEHGKQTPISLH